MMLAAPVWGILADRFGRKLMVERSMFGGAVVMLFMGLVRSGEELVILRAIQGLITGAVAASSALIASIAPRDRMGYAMGVLQVGMGSGFALGPIVGGAVADAFGYDTAFYVTSALLLLAGVTVTFGVPRDAVPRKKARGSRDDFLAAWRQIISMPGVLIAYTLRFLCHLGRMMVIPIIPLFLQLLLPENAKVNTFTGLVVGIAAGATAASALFLGRLGDQIGHRKILITSAVVAGMIYLPQGFATEGWHLLFLYGLVGVAMGGLIPSISALLARYTSPGEAGAVYGLDNSIQAGAGALAPLLGSGIAIWISLRASFILAAITLVSAGLLGMWRLPEPPKEPPIMPLISHIGDH